MRIVGPLKMKPTRGTFSSAGGRASRSVVVFASIVFLLLACRRIHADGGVVRLREAAGPFMITLFISPAVPRVGVADASVMVQCRDSGETVLGATEELSGT